MLYEQYYDDISLDNCTFIIRHPLEIVVLREGIKNHKM